MDSTATAIPYPVPPQPRPTPTGVPASFEAALRDGWKIERERSTISVDDKRRRGIVTLQKSGAGYRLQVGYVATAKAWNFTAPEAIE